MRRAKHLRRTLPLVSAMAIALALAWSTAPAQAAFPGRNGSILFTSNIKGTWELYTMRPDGTLVKRITDLGTRDDPLSYFANWSPDGTKIVTTVGAGTDDLDLYTMNADGSDLTPLIVDPATRDDAPAWSPDGSQVIFARDGVGLMRIDADGSGLTRLSNDGFCPTYSADGSQILYDGFKGGLIAAIWAMNADGSNPHRITPRSIRAGCMDVSPDGAHVVFYSNQNGILPTSLYAMNIDGTGITHLTDAGCCHHDVAPKYSPDGTQIAFVSDRNYWNDCCFDLFIMNADGSNVRQITSNLTIDGCRENGNCVTPDWGGRP